MGSAHCIHDTILVDDDVALMNELAEFIAVDQRKVLSFDSSLDAISHARDNICLC
jgi:FixJ family two-component response regulator